MAKPAMKLLRHFPAGFGPRTRCCKEKKGETAMFVLLRIKNRPARQKTWCVIFPTTARKFGREGYICCDTSQLKAQYDLGLDKKTSYF